MTLLNYGKTSDARPFIIAAMATLFALLAVLTIGGAWASANVHGGTGTGDTGGTGPTAEPEGDHGDKPDTPPGQLVRRGLAGTVGALGASSFTVSTKWGLVVVLVDDDTTFRKPPEGVVGFDALNDGDRVGVLLSKTPSEGDGGSGGTGPMPEVIRTALALKVMIVPGKATRSFARGLLLGKGKGHLKFVGEDGEEVEIETDVDVDGEEGDEIILITRSQGHGKGPKVVNSAAGDFVEQRLARLAQKRADIRQKLEQLKQRVIEKRTALLERMEQRTSGDVRIRVREALEGTRRGRPDPTNVRPDRSNNSSQNRGSSARPDDDGGKPDDRGGRPDDRGDRGRGRN